MGKGFDSCGNIPIAASTSASYSGVPIAGVVGVEGAILGAMGGMVAGVC